MSEQAKNIVNHVKNVVVIKSCDENQNNPLKILENLEALDTKDIVIPNVAYAKMTRTERSKLKGPCPENPKQQYEFISPTNMTSCHCKYPTEERLDRPTIQHNGITDFRYTSDKNKAKREIKQGIQYKLIDSKILDEAPWCKRNGLQDQWMEDPKYQKRSLTSYSTPYPCCPYTTTPVDSIVPLPANARFDKPNGKKGWECCEKIQPSAGHQNHKIKAEFRDLVPTEPRKGYMWGKCNMQT